MAQRWIPQVARSFPIDPARTESIAGGVQIGEDFQVKRLVWGVGVDLDFLNPKVVRSSLKSTGAAYASAGWAAGGGTDIGLNGAWSITAEYLRVNLGHASHSAATCNGPTSACAAFAGVFLDSGHNGVRAY
jgi:hypothetical protein